MSEQQVFSKLIELGRVSNKREELQEYCIQQFDMVKSSSDYTPIENRLR